jgi:crotonobetainyl-CoA:carnitine CoA-transferase CaiB-like acyl-CoA transferase
LAAGHWPGNGSDLVTGGTPRYRLYRTRDGKVLAAAPIENKFWDVFCDVIGLDDDLRDDAKDPAATIARVAEIIAADDASVWAARFAGKDSCCSVVVTIRDALNDPHFRARGLFDHVLINEDGRTLPALPVPIDSAFRAPPETAIAALHSGLKTRISPGESRARVQGFECRRAAHGSIGRSVIALSVRAG